MDNIVISSIGIFHHGMKYLKHSNDNTRGNSTIECDKIINGEKLDSEILKYLPYAEVRRVDKICKLLLVSGINCMENLQFKRLKDFKSDIGAIGSTVFGSMSSSEDFVNTALNKGVKNASPIIFPFTVPNASNGILTTKLGVNGFNTTLSGYNPIGYSFDLLNLNRTKGLFVSGFDEVTKQIAEISLPGNLFYNGNYSEGASTFFITKENFAKKNNLPVLFYLIGFEIAYNINNNYTFDNSDSIEKETILRPIKEIFSRKETNKYGIKTLVSAFTSDSKAAVDEKSIIDNTFGVEKVQILYPKDELGESFANNNFVNIICGYTHLLKNPSETQIIINSYDLGGNFSSTLISIQKP
ncbi:hypothetical protein PXC01_05640 [Maribacter sp. M208]|uniref:hypothetical protein n=1 Tax=Maribacter huludaoensis TaxID=3030010 RepID=UPI0023EA9818|nr:hypothetical protein [Maribacter huludaoensis]MDF4221061.1 hypothetical protein [Maribacter huludaoensis]